MPNERTPTPARGTGFIPPYNKQRISGHPGARVWEFDKFHPTEQPEGIVENLIKGLGVRSLAIARDDFPFLEQFLHPNRTILPEQPLRPTIGSVPQGWKVYGLPPAKNTNWYKSIAERGIDKLWDWEDGLGRSSFTASPDGSYSSVYDEWNFDEGKDTRLPAPLGTLAKLLLNRVGRPFAVYERFPAEK